MHASLSRWRSAPPPACRGDRETPASVARRARPRCGHPAVTNGAPAHAVAARLAADGAPARAVAAREPPTGRLPRLPPATPPCPDSVAARLGEWRRGGAHQQPVAALPPVSQAHCGEGKVSPGVVVIRADGG